jgi:iron-sulfur cluster repair protein YtfE (RIC family)
MNAITMLEADHKKVKGLLADLEKTTERGVRTRQELFERIREELTVHEVIEEEIFYPALKEHPRAKDLVLEAFEEHHVVDRLMGELSELAPDDETWGAKAKVMQENLEHHIEEEEGEMFPKARRVFNAVELEELGARMATRRKEAKPDVEEIAEVREAEAG